MRALSIRQPWLDFIFRFDKRIENRTYSVKPGPILLHASRSKPTTAHLAKIFDVFELELPKRGDLTPDSFSYGVILGAAVVIECFEFDLQTEFTEEAAEQDESLFWAEGPMCWRLDQVVKLKTAVPWKGTAGIFHIPDDVVHPILPKRWAKKWIA